MIISLCHSRRKDEKAKDHFVCTTLGKITGGTDPAWTPFSDTFMYVKGPILSIRLHFETSCQVLTSIITANLTIIFENMVVEIVDNFYMTRYNNNEASADQGSVMVWLFRLTRASALMDGTKLARTKKRRTVYGESYRLVSHLLFPFLSPLQDFGFVIQRPSNFSSTMSTCSFQ